MDVSEMKIEVAASSPGSDDIKPDAGMLDVQTWIKPDPDIPPDPAFYADSTERVNSQGITESANDRLVMSNHFGPSSPTDCSDHGWSMKAEVLAVKGGLDGEAAETLPANFETECRPTDSIAPMTSAANFRTEQNEASYRPESKPKVDLGGIPLCHTTPSAQLRGGRCVAERVKMELFDAEDGSDSEAPMPFTANFKTEQSEIGNNSETKPKVELDAGAGDPKEEEVFDMKGGSGDEADVTFAGNFKSEWRESSNRSEMKPKIEPDVDVSAGNAAEDDFGENFDLLQLRAVSDTRFPTGPCVSESTLSCERVNAGLTLNQLSRNESAEEEAEQKFEIYLDRADSDDNVDEDCNESVDKCCDDRVDESCSNSAEGISDTCSPTTGNRVLKSAVGCENVSRLTTEGGSVTQFPVGNCVSETALSFERVNQSFVTVAYHGRSNSLTTEGGSDTQFPTGNCVSETTLSCERVNQSVVTVARTGRSDSVTVLDQSSSNSNGNVAKRASHVLQRNGLKPFQCNTCTSTFATFPELFAHTKTHKQDNPFRCGECGAGFKTWALFKTHVKDHMENKARQLIEGFDIKYRCHRCKASFSNSDQLQAHRKTEHKLTKKLRVARDTRDIDALSAKKQMREKAATLTKPTFPQPGMQNCQSTECGAPCNPLSPGAPCGPCEEHGPQGSLRLNELKKSIERPRPPACDSSPASGENCSAEEHKRKYCEVKYAWTYDLKERRKYHMFECTRCKKKYASVLSLEGHMATCQKGNKKCSRCDETFVTLSDLYQHFVSSHAHNCAYCKKDFSSLEELKLHLAVHAKKHRCEICDSAFAGQAELKAHIESHVPDEDGRYRCPDPQCSASFSQLDSLIQHRREHDKPHKCLHCSGRYKTRKSMLCHVRLIHNHTSTGKKRHRCTVCSASVRELKEHMRIHTGEKPYACSYCPARYARRMGLLSHLRQHRDERPYSCVQCDKSFFTSYDLRKHVQKTHGKEMSSTSNPFAPRTTSGPC